MTYNRIIRFSPRHFKLIDLVNQYITTVFLLVVEKAVEKYL
jgi:hypothetical protein